MLWNKYVFLFTAFLLPGAIHAQRFELINTYTKRLTVQIDLANETLKNFQAEGDTEISDPKLQLRLGELVLNYQLPLVDISGVVFFDFSNGAPEEKKFSETGQYFVAELLISLNGESITPKPEDLKGTLHQPIKTGGTAQQIVWTDLLEEYINLVGELELELRLELWGVRRLPFGVTCGIEPEFSAKQRLPYYIAAGVGVAFIGAGELFRRKADVEYQNYVSQETVGAAEPFYQEVIGQHQRYRLLTWTGAAILTVDAAWYFFRQSRYKSKQKIYRDFCGDNILSMAPVFELPTRRKGVNPRGQIGVQLALRF